MNNKPTSTSWAISADSASNRQFISDSDERKVAMVELLKDAQLLVSAPELLDVTIALLIYNDEKDLFR